MTFRTFLVSAVKGFSIGVLDHIVLAFICFFARFLRVRAHTTAEEVALVQNVDIDDCTLL